MTDAVGDVVGDDNVREAFDALLLDGVLDRFPGRLALPDQVAVGTLENGHTDAQS